jgi:hypothetical protein
METQPRQQKRNIMRLLLTIIILTVLAGPSWAQKSDDALRIAYESALLDSAYRYELIKPALAHLKTAYDYRGKEIETINTALSLCEVQTQMQAKGFDKRIRKQGRESFRKGAATGFVGTVVVMLTLLFL